MPIIDTDKGPIEFPDSMSTGQIEAALQSMHSDTSAAPSATATPRPGMPNLNMNRQWASDLPRLGLKVLPDIMTGLGAMSGAPAGPAGMILMGGLGRGGGEAMRQLGEHAMGEGPQTPGEAYGRINQATGAGALMESAGLPVGGMLKWAAPKLARAGLRTPVSKEMEAQMPGEAIDFEKTAKTMLREKAPSANRARELRQQSAENTSDLIARSDKRLKKFSAADLSEELIRQNQRRLKRRLTADERKNIVVMVRERSNELLDELTPGASRVPQTPGGNPARARFTGGEVKSLAQAAQDRARSIINNEAPGKGRTIAGQRSLDRAIGRGAVRTKNRIPGVRESDLRTRDLIGLEKALIAREGSHSPTVPQLMSTSVMGLGGLASGHAPQAPVAALAAYGLSSPWALRRMALMANEPLTQNMASQWPVLPAALWDALSNNK